MSERLRLGDMLVAAGLVSEAQVEEALASQRRSGKRLGETLVALGYVNEGQMTQVLSNQLSLPWANLYHVDFSRELLDRVPAELAERYRVIPVYVRHVRRQGDTLYVAIDDPLNLDALQLVADACGLPVKAMVASPSDIENAIRVYYLGLPPLGANAKTALVESDEPELTEELEELEDEQDAEPESPAPVLASPELASPELASPDPPSSEPEPATPEPALASPEPEAPAPEPVRPAAEAPAPEPRAPSPEPTPAASARQRALRALTLTFLDGTEVRMPSQGARAKAEPAERTLTTRDLVHALTARAAGEDVSDVLPDDAWEPLFATLLSILMRKGLIADWEFVDEWKKHRKKP